MKWASTPKMLKTKNIPQIAYIDDRRLKMLTFPRTVTSAENRKKGLTQSHHHTSVYVSNNTFTTRKVVILVDKQTHTSVVVSMSIGIVAFSKDPLVFLGTQFQTKKKQVNVWLTHFVSHWSA